MTRISFINVAPPSLVNIFKELSTDIPGFRTPAHGNLETWAAQGVLMLNAVLTVREKTPNSHANKVSWRFAPPCLFGMTEGTTIIDHAQ